MADHRGDHRPEETPVSDPLLTRREAIAALGCSTTVPLMMACNRKPGATHPATPASPDAAARALLDQIGEGLLRLSPEAATSLGIDTNARQGLRSQLADRSAEGQQQIASLLRSDLARANAVDAAR